MGQPTCENHLMAYAELSLVSFRVTPYLEKCSFLSINAATGSIKLLHWEPGGDLVVQLYESDFDKEVKKIVGKSGSFKTKIKK
jgi:hypothetical protein